MRTLDEPATDQPHTSPGFCRVQHHVARGQVQPIEIERAPGASGMANDDDVGVAVDHAHEFSPHPVEAASGRAR